MNKFDIPLVGEGLTVYAIERQNGWERHRPEGAPPWQDQRRLWTDAILQGMAKLEEQVPNPQLMEQFDRDLEQANGSAAAVPASLQLQRGTIQNLRNFVTALEDTGNDRRQVNVVRELLEDMASHLPWAGKDNRLDLARDETERSLVRMTAQMPTRFTHIVLGGDAGPHWASGFVPGCVKGTEAVKQTSVYQEAVRNYPEIRTWPALCVAYAGRGLPSAFGTVDASEFDLEIMNRTGDRFLDERGVSCVGGPYQMTITTAPEMTTQTEMQMPGGTMEQFGQNPFFEKGNRDNAGNRFAEGKGICGPDSPEQSALFHAMRAVRPMETMTEQLAKCPLLQGSRPLAPEDFDHLDLMDAEDDFFLFSMDVLADEETVFGQKLSGQDEDSCITTCAVYSSTTGQVCDMLEVVLWLPQDEKVFRCELSPEVTDSLKQKMDAFYLERYETHLPGLTVQGLDGYSPPQVGPVM